MAKINDIDVSAMLVNNLTDVLVKSSTRRIQRQLDCPYCHSDGSTRWDNRSQWGSKAIADELLAFPNELAVNISFPALFNTGGNLYRIHYCPMCGRKLNGEW